MLDCRKWQIMIITNKWQTKRIITINTVTFSYWIMHSVDQSVAASHSAYNIHAWCIQNHSLQSCGNAATHPWYTCFWIEHTDASIAIIFLNVCNAVPLPNQSSQSNIYISTSNILFLFVVASIRPLLAQLSLIVLARTCLHFMSDGVWWCPMDDSLRWRRHWLPNVTSSRAQRSRWRRQISKK